MGWSHILLAIYSALLVIFCSKAAYSDIKSGIVPNKLLKRAIIVIGIFQILICIITQVWPWNENGQGAIYFSNIVIACIVSIGLYVADIWAPGDAKLFMTIVLLYPPKLQTASEGSIFPSLQIIVWMFSIGYIYLVVESAIKHKSIQTRLQQTKAIISKQTALSIICSIAIIYVYSLFANLLVSSLLPDFFFANRSFCVLIIICTSILINKFPVWGRMLLAVISLSGVFYLVYQYQIRFMWSCQSLISLMIAFLVACLTRIVQKHNYVSISPDQLCTGMILSTHTVLRFMNSKISGLPTQTTETRRSKLKDEGVKAVQKWANKENENIIIIKMLPFAPFIALGTVFEVVLGWFLMSRSAL